MPAPEELARQKYEFLLADWSSGDKTSSAGEARRVSAGSANQFQQFVTPDTGRNFTGLYNVQHLTSNRLDPAARVTNCIIERRSAMLRVLFLGDTDATRPKHAMRPTARVVMSTVTASPRI